MKSSIKRVAAIYAACAACAAWAPLLAGGSPEPEAWNTREELTFDLTAKQPVELPDGPWTPRVMALPGPDMEMEKAALRLSLPNFTNSVSVQGRRYTFTQLGADPSRSRAPRTVLPVVIIPVTAVFDDGSFFDPTSWDPCAHLFKPTMLAAQSPIFQPADYGDGARQYLEEFRRLEYWSLTGAPGGRNPNYSVTVAPNSLHVGGFQVGALVKFHGFPTKPATCGRIGLVDIHQWDSFVRQTVLPAFRQYGAGPESLVLLLMSNVVFYDGNHCCTLGYHSWLNLGGVQTYGVAEIDSSRYFKNVFDVGPLAHELGEWYDDPLVSNATPRWGHVGQVSGCQGNLEVGDPLSGHFLEVAMPNGVRYHPQELAFFSWFFGQAPSLGFDGWYSMGGTFRAPAAPCH
jgi:hypothetical protein